MTKKKQEIYQPTLDEIVNIEETYENGLKRIVKLLRSSFNKGITRTLRFRLEQLTSLERMVKEQEGVILEALKRDLNKSSTEGSFTELECVKNEIRYLKSNLKKLASKRHVRRNFCTIFDNAYQVPEPYGTVLVIGAWNYPFYILLGPVLGAIAAGNTIVIKPSEMATNMERVFADLLPRYLDQSCYQLITGGPEVTTNLLKEKFDMIFFTGSPTVGRIIYKAASEHLTPVVLELGGKSPVYLHDDMLDMSDDLLNRILYGKLINSGQTCVAPDYILCSEKMQNKLIKKLPEIIKKNYGTDLKKSDNLCRIINERNVKRLQALLDSSKEKIVYGGDVDIEERWVHPTILKDCTKEDKIMQEEIFGPIFPIMVVKDEDEAIYYINLNEKPLALYVFTYDTSVQKKFEEQTSSGTFCINETILFMVVENLPFGGIGNSGMGSYHGQASFDAFSHLKSVLNHSDNLIVTSLEKSKYGPPSKWKNFALNEMVKYRNYPLPSLMGIFSFITGFASALIAFLAKEYFWVKN